MPDFTTGTCQLADVGKLEYNGCIFSPLFETSVSGSIVKDNAGRVTRYMEYIITADGYVTGTIDPTTRDSRSNLSGSMYLLRTLLTQQGAPLVYEGRGLDIRINVTTGNNVSTKDVAWGPVPKILEFQPLGGGNSAKIRWQVVVHMPEVTNNAFNPGRGNTRGINALLQFNYETSLSYNDEGFSSLSIRGTMEIPMTWGRDRTLTHTVDSARSIIENRLWRGIDLSRFRIVRREFSASRDKRTMEFHVELEEKPYMDLPMYCSIARGSFNVRPARAGAGLASWHCTLKGTYTVRGDTGRRAAWIQYLALLRLRMRQSEQPGINPLNVQNPPQNNGAINILSLPLIPIGLGAAAPIAALQRLWGGGSNPPPSTNNENKAFLIDFSFDEGIYLDSKTVSFSATWRLTCFLANILLASGLWTKLPERDALGRNLWAMSMRNVSGVESWLQNRLDPSLDVIVDFGGG